MIETYNDNVTKSGPWVAEFGNWERVMSGEITNEECNILERSSPEIEVLRCNLKNINRDKLHKHQYYILHRENDEIETWFYEGIGRIDNSYCVFSRPPIKNLGTGKDKKKREEDYRNRCNEEINRRKNNQLEIDL